MPSLNVSVFGQSGSVSGAANLYLGGAVTLRNGTYYLDADRVFVGGQWIVSPYSNLIVSTSLTVGSGLTLSNGTLFGGQISGGQLALSNPDSSSIQNPLNQINNPVYVTISGSNRIGAPYKYSAALMTLAGASGTLGHIDGTGTAARLNYPEGITVTADGVLYLADSANGVIRSMSTSGTVATLAASALPSAVVADGLGNAYTIGAGTLRKITPAGIASTFASGTFFGAGLAIDKNGSLYVCDSASTAAEIQAGASYRNARIRKINTQGAASTVIEFDPAQGYPRHEKLDCLAVDAAGNIYVTLADACIVRKITPAGVVSTLAGKSGSPGGQDAVGENARFGAPTGIATDDAGLLYVADSANRTIRRINPETREVTTIIGSINATVGRDGFEGTAAMLEPYGIAVETSGAGFIYVTDAADHTLRVLLVSPEIVKQPEGQSMTAGGTMTLTAAASASPTATYQWYRNGTAVSGAYGATLTLAGGQVADSGTYYLQASNLMGSATSNAVAVTFAAAPVAPVNNNTASAGSGGGGGAPSTWFLLALGALATLRLRRTTR